ncbi:MAG: DUF6673 family protein [[Clostridium] scindens]
MSLWKFGTFEQEIDFTDADFMDALEEAQEQLVIQSKETPKVGKKSDIIRAQVDCFAQFFDHIFGPETSEKMYEGRVSLNWRSSRQNHFPGLESRKADGWIKTIANIM